MNLLDNLGQMIWIGLEGPSLTRREREFIATIQPAGVIYFARNIESPRQVAKLSCEVRKLYKGSHPPLIGIDQEGGRVARLGPPFTVFPGNDFLGRYHERTGRLDLVEAQARAMAIELRAIGVNCNFAPVADVNSNDQNPIIGPKRAFSQDPKAVARFVTTVISTFRKEKIISCAKHFPGHGDTWTDSHKVLPIVKASKRTLFARELIPFRAAIRACVPTIMTAHVVYPALDKKNCATLSSTILVGLLRKTLKYRGLILSDDLEMNAIARHRALADGALDAITAGVNCVLVCKSLEQSQLVYEKLYCATLKNDVNRKHIQDSIGKMVELRKAYGKSSAPSRKTTTKSYSWPKHRILAQQICVQGNC